MQLSARADRLRTAIESAAGVKPGVEEVGPARVRISAPIAEDSTLASFRSVLAVVRRGDDWGSSGETGAVVLWAEIQESTKGRP
jgi:hypothetical protein